MALTRDAGRDPQKRSLTLEKAGIRSHRTRMTPSRYFSLLYGLIFATYAMGPVADMGKSTPWPYQCGVPLTSLVVGTR